MSAPTWDDEDFIRAISETGCAFANDYDDDKDGWFGFHVSAAEGPGQRAVLTASWQPAEKLDDEAEEADPSLKQVAHYYLIPFDPEAKAEPEGKHERG